MGPFSRSAEQRGAARTAADIPAILQLVTGDRRGTLVNLSETGAKIQMEDPPATGVTGLLKWRDAEAFCRVVWTTGDACGVAFERRIRQELVAASVVPSGPRGPAAGLSNIPLGRKRGS